MKFFVIFLVVPLLASANTTPSCKDLEEIKFDRPGTYKDYPYDWARLGDYHVWSGEKVPHKIINAKEKTECVLDYPHVRSLKKFKDHDLLFVDAYREKLEYTAVVQMKDCKNLWELEINTEISELTFNSSMKVVKNDLIGSSLEKCGHCWNDKTEACRNLPVSQ